MREFLFSFQGRASRQQYWLYSLACVFASLAIAGIDVVTGLYDPESGFGMLGALFALATLWPNLAVGVKRWHDRDKSGWWVLIILVPVLGFLWTLVECGFLKGTEGDNRFGPDPLAA